MKNIYTLAKRYFAEIYFFVLSMIIFFPLLGRGYILTLDMIFTPQMNYLPQNMYGLYSETARHISLNVLAQFLPASVVQKLILISIFFLAGYLMYRLLASFKRANLLFAVTASTLYVWNPFTYTRLLAGHWAFLLGYALFPLFVTLLLKYFRTRKLEHGLFLATGLVWFSAGLASVHHFVIYLFPVTAIAVVLAFQRKTWQNGLNRAILLLLLVLLMSSSWLLPSVVFSDITKLSADQYLFFASTPDLRFGLTFNLLGLYGFWAEQSLGLMPKDINPLWWLSSILFTTIAVFPLLLFIIKQFTKRLPFKFGAQFRMLIPSLVIMGTSGLVLAHGSYGLMRPVWNLFSNRIPFLQPFREAQKFLMLYIFSFSVLFYLGLFSLQQFINSMKAKKTIFSFTKRVNFRFLIASIIITLIFLYTYTLAFGAVNQLALSFYPGSWFALSEKLEQSEVTKTIMVLPWQSYAEFSFVKRRSANPAPSFFDGYVISEQAPSMLVADRKCDLEFSGVKKQEQVSLCLNYNDDNQLWIDQIKSAGVDYVLVTKEKESAQFDFLEDIEHFLLIISDQHSDIYEVL